MAERATHAAAPAAVRPLPGLKETVWLIAAWCFVVAAGGHGVAPLGVTLFAPLLGLGFAPMAIGWAGPALLLWSRAGGRRVPFMAGLATTFLLWGLFVAGTELGLISAVTSAPYLRLLWHHIGTLRGVDYAD